MCPTHEVLSGLLILFILALLALRQKLDWILNHQRPLVPLSGIPTRSVCHAITQRLIF